MGDEPGCYLPAIVVGVACPDDSYDFSNLSPFLDQLRAGYQLVMGNRFRGGIAPGAMPPLHYYLGNPVLTQELRTATTALLELPRGFSTKVGEIIREEVRRLVGSGAWAARYAAPDAAD